MEEIFQYKTFTKESEGYYKDKGSKFIALAYHVETIDEIKQTLEEVKKKYYDARHHCYAYRISPEDVQERSNDDGEPSGTAGKPIINQIYSKDLYDVLLIVVRYFGGTKLGVSGLIAAYKTAAIDAIDNNKIRTNYITKKLDIKYDYPLMNIVMKIIKDEKLKIHTQDFGLDCKICLDIKKESYKEIREKFSQIYGITVT